MHPVEDELDITIDIYNSRIKLSSTTNERCYIDDLGNDKIYQESEAENIFWCVKSPNKNTYQKFIDSNIEYVLYYISIGREIAPFPLVIYYQSETEILYNIVNYPDYYHTSVTFSKYK